MEEMTSQLQSMFSNISEIEKRQKIARGRRIEKLKDEEAAKMINEEELKTRAIQAVEQNGIVFIDEIDKVGQASRRKHRRCFPGRRTKGPASSDRGVDRQHPGIRHDQNGSHSVYCLRSISPGETF